MSPVTVKDGETKGLIISLRRLRNRLLRNGHHNEARPPSFILFFRSLPAGFPCSLSSVMVPLRS